MSCLTSIFKISNNGVLDDEVIYKKNSYWLIDAIV